MRKLEVVDLKKILRSSIERVIVREEQRAVWKNWRISLETLDENAIQVLHVMALFGASEILESLMIPVVDNVQAESTTRKLAYTNWVKWELVNKVSLVQVEQSAVETSYQMHPLIRQFLASDVLQEKDKLN